MTSFLVWTRLCLLALTIATATAGCHRGTASSAATTPARSLQDRYNSLGDALRTLPNVQVTGQTVMYRGMSSLTSDQEMRFVVRGALLGTLSQVEPLYPLNTIRAVRVLPPVDANSRYGALASAGVIEIVLVD